MRSLEKKYQQASKDYQMRCLRNAFTFFATALKLNTENINASIANKGQLDKGTYGICGYNAITNAVNILIRETANTFGMIECLAHEMVHAKQMQSGRLTYESDVVFYPKWFPLIPKTKTYTIFDGFKYDSETRYASTLYEIEANEKGAELAAEYIRYLTDSNDLISYEKEIYDDNSSREQQLRFDWLQD